MTCHPNASCHAEVEDLEHQLKDATRRHDSERSARLHLTQSYEKLSQQNMDLKQQNYAKSEACRKGNAAYRDLEKAYKQVQCSLGLVHQERQCLQGRLEQERIYVQQADARLDHLLRTTRMVTQTLYLHTIDKSDPPDEKKREEKKLDYAAVYLERDLLQIDCEELKACLSKEIKGKYWT